MYESPTTLRAIKDTRKDWTVTTWADAFGTWHAKIESAVGWGNYGVRDFGRHASAARERARRAIHREIAARQGAPVGTIRLEVKANRSDGLGVLHSITYGERTN